MWKMPVVCKWGVGQPRSTEREVLGSRGRWLLLWQPVNSSQQMWSQEGGSVTSSEIERKVSVYVGVWRVWWGGRSEVPFLSSAQTALGNLEATRWQVPSQAPTVSSMGGCLTPDTRTTHTGGSPAFRRQAPQVLSGCTPPGCSHVTPFSEHQPHALE